MSRSDATPDDRSYAGVALGFVFFLVALGIAAIVETAVLGVDPVVVAATGVALAVAFVGLVYALVWVGGR